VNSELEDATTHESVIPSSVILSVAKDLALSLRVNFARNLLLLRAQSEMVRFAHHDTTVGLGSLSSIPNSEFGLLSERA